MNNESHPERIPIPLYAAMFMQFSVGGCVLPFVSIHLRDVGLSMHEISRVFMISSSMLLFFPFFWGMLADRFVSINRLFALLNVLACGALFWIGSQTGFVGLVIGFTAFYASYHPTLTLINALSFHHLPNPREQFGKLRAWGSLGWIVPSLPIALWLLTPGHRSLEFIFWLAMACCIGMAFTTFALPPVDRDGGPSLPGLPGAAPAIGYGAALKRLVRDTNYVMILGSFFLIAASFSILVYYSTPYMEECGIDRAWVGPIQCIGVLLEIAIFPYLRRFIREWGFAATMTVGALALFVRQLCYAFSTNPWILSLSYLLAGMLIVFYHIVASILINQLAAREVRATAQGLFVLCGSGLGPMFANWVTGLFMRDGATDLQPVFLFAAGLALLATLLIASRWKHLRLHSASS